MNFLQLNRRVFLASATAALASTVSGGAMAAAEAMLEHVNFLIPFGPGGSFDKTCRASAAALMAANLVKSATVENVAGEGGALGYKHLIDPGVDNSNTLMLVGTSILARRGKGQFPYDVSDLVSVSRFSAEALTFAVKSDSRFQTLTDVVDALRADPASVRFASDSDLGLSEHLCAAKMLAKAGIAPETVTYVQKSGHGQVPALLAGEVEVAIAASADILDHYRDKSARVLAVSADQRLAQMPDVPTVAEAGLPDAVFYNARGFFMAPGTDLTHANKMGDLLEKMVATPEWEIERAEAKVTMLFARLPESQDFFNGQERDIRELQTALGIYKQ